MELNGRNVDRSSLEVSSVDTRDYPDFCDAYICSATWQDGTALTDSELEQLNEDYPEVVNELAFESCLG
jgi:hypothetical protein